MPAPDRRRRALLAAALPALLASCGPAPSTSAPGPQARCEPVEPATEVLFRLRADGSPPGFGEVPFPSDLYREADGTLVDELPGLERVLVGDPGVIARALAPLSGFGRSTASFFFTSGPVAPISLPRDAPASLAPGATAVLVNVDRASPGFGTRVPSIARYLPSLQAVSVLPHPGTLLEARTRYAAVLTTGATSAPCTPLRPSAALSTLAALDAGARRSEVERLFGDALDALVETGVIAGRSGAAGVAVFTTMSATEDMVAIARAVADPARYAHPRLLLDEAEIAPYRTFYAARRGTSPTLREWLGDPEEDEAGHDLPGVDNEGGMPHDHVAAVITGAFQSARFLDPATDHVSPDDGSGPPQLVGTWLVPVTIVLPRAPPPDGGWPVVIYGHGLSNSRHSILPIANELCRRGFAVAGIDFVYHGTRDGIADEANNYPGTYAGPDGLPDGMGTNLRFFGGLTDGMALRDHFRQTVADQLSLVRLLKSPALDLSIATDAVGEPARIDGSRIYWYGQSLGGIVGAMVATYAPDVKAAALGVPGGGFIHLMAANSASLQGAFGELIAALVGARGTDPFDSFHPVANLIATGVEPGDPLVHVPHLVRDPLPLGPGGTSPPRNVAVLFALGDEVLPNRSTHALLHAAGIPLVLPALDRDDDWGVPFPVVEGPLHGNVVTPDGVATAGAIEHSPANHSLCEARHADKVYVPGFPFDDEVDRFPELARPVRIEQPLAGVLAEAAYFFATARSSGPGTLRQEQPPRADFDGDGVDDAAERRAGTDPFDPSAR